MLIICLSDQLGDFIAGCLGESVGEGSEVVVVDIADFALFVWNDLHLLLFELAESFDFLANFFAFLLFETKAIMLDFDSSV